MSLRRAFHIILNPIAGARRSALLNAVVERLKQGGAEVTVELTERPGHATELARRAAERGQADVIVAAGGDGTINEVARGLLGQGVPLAIIPLGTANVLAIELSLRPRAAEIADMLLTGPAHLVGTGLVGGEIFLLMVGIGFDGVVVHDINPALKKLSGKGAFVWAGIKAWAKGPGRDIRLIVDGREKRAQWAIVINGRYFAGPYVLSREGDISQPGLMLYLFRNGGRLALIRYLIALGLGRVAKLPDVEILPVRQVRFLEPEGLAVEVDGDARGALPQTVEQGTRFLRLVVPSGWKPEETL